MPLPNPYNESWYAGDGVTTTFSFGYNSADKTGFDAISADYVKCHIVFDDGSIVIPSFTVDIATGKLTIITLTTPDGTVLNTAPAGSQVRIFRDVPEVQSLDSQTLKNYTNVQMAKVLDLIVAMIQENKSHETHNVPQLQEGFRDVLIAWLKESDQDKLLFWDNDSRTLTPTDFTKTQIVQSPNGMFFRTRTVTNPDRIILEYSLDKITWYPVADAGTLFHNSLLGRDLADAHPISAITNLSQVLDTKFDKIGGTISGNVTLDKSTLTLISNDGTNTGVAEIRAGVDNSLEIYLANEILSYYRFGRTAFRPGLSGGNTDLGLEDKPWGTLFAKRIFNGGKIDVPASTGTIALAEETVAKDQGVVNAGKVLVVGTDGDVTLAAGATAVELHGLRGDYCSQYGIVDPKAIITTPVDNNDLIIPAGLRLKIPGKDTFTTLTSPITHQTQSTSDFTLMYVEESDEYLECDCYYQVGEPEPNGEERFQAWWNGAVWQFRSNDTGNVWRQSFATPLCDCHFTNGNITRIDMIGYRVQNTALYATTEDFDPVKAETEQLRTDVEEVIGESAMNSAEILKIQGYIPAGTSTTNQLATEADVDRAAESGTNIGGYWYAKTSSDYTPANPTNARENYFDFTTNIPYTANADLSGWTAGEPLVAPVDIDANIHITKKFWNLEETDNIGGIAYWSHTDRSWVYQPAFAPASGTARNIGELQYSLLPLVDAGMHLVDGALINGAGIYQAFVDKIINDYVPNYPSLFITEEEWQASVQQYGVCGKFVATPAISDGYYAWFNTVTNNYRYTKSATPAIGDQIYISTDGETEGATVSDISGLPDSISINGKVTGLADEPMTRAADRDVITDSPATVRLPRVTGIVEGTLDATALGAIMEAGLPNITGRFTARSNDNGDNGNEYILGAFTKSAVTAYSSSSGSVANRGQIINFDASRSSSTYGNSTTVQPQTIKGYLYMVIATAAKTDVQVDIDNIATDLATKMPMPSLWSSDDFASFRRVMNEFDWDNKQGMNLSSFPFTAPEDGMIVGRLWRGSQGENFIYVNGVNISQTYITNEMSAMPIFVLKGDVVSISGFNEAGQLNFVPYKNGVGGTNNLILGLNFYGTYATLTDLTTASADLLATSLGKGRWALVGDDATGYTRYYTAPTDDTFSAFEWLNAGADPQSGATINLDNISQTGKETSIGWGIPDYSAGVTVKGNTGAGSYTLPKSGIMIFYSLANTSSSGGDNTLNISVNGVSFASIRAFNYNSDSIIISASAGDVVSWTHSGSTTTGSIKFYPFKGV